MSKKLILLFTLILSYSTLSAKTPYKEMINKIPTNPKEIGYLCIKFSYEDHMNDNKPFGHVVFKTWTKNKEYTFTINPFTGFYYGAELPNGTYKKWELNFYYHNGDLAKTYAVNEPVLIRKDSITVFPLQLYFTLKQITENGKKINSMTWDMMQIGMGSLTDFIINDFESDQNFFTWKTLLFGDVDIFDIIQE